MMQEHQRILTRKGQRGAVAIIVAVFLLFAGIGFAAFAIDFGYRHVAQNELQNAADAGALAGARALYYGDGSGINVVDGGDPTGEWPIRANKVAYEAAIANLSAKTPVEVNNWDQNTGDANEDVQRGHWSFGRGSLPEGFYCDEDNFDMTGVLSLGEYSDVELDENKLFINAVRVVTRREATPVRTFLASIFGRKSWELKAEAVAYRGFTASVPPDTFDTIIAICAQSLWEEDVDGDGKFSAGDKMNCTYGRMLNSGGVFGNHNTGAWTNHDQPDDENDNCVQPSAGTQEGQVFDLLETNCGKNPNIAVFKEGLGLNGGVIEGIIEHPTRKDISECWKNGYYDMNNDGQYDENIDKRTDEDGNGIPEYPWTVTLPVVDCPDNNPKNCSTLIGSVTVNVVWVLEKANKIGTDAPRKMWRAGKNSFWEWPGDPPLDTEEDGIARWNDFVSTDPGVGLQMITGVNPDGTVTYGPATYPDGFKQKSVYFLPDCDYQPPVGTSGGINFGTLAEIPVLVK